MQALNRLKNAFEAGGVKEIVRKLFFHAVYKLNNQRTKRLVEHSSLEYGLNKAPRSPEIIVSLTSFPERFRTIVPCLKSLLLQSFKPDRLIVYLGSDTKETDLTKPMRELEAYGVEYRFDTEKNLKSHKKYYYAVKDFPDGVIVTADDDLYYPKDWLESLYKSYLRYPHAISARRVHRIALDRNGNLKKYNHWTHQYRTCKEPSRSLIATGGSGKLYPPHMLSDELTNDKVFMKVCPNADDIWIKCIEALSDVKVVWAPNNEVDLQSTAKDITNRLSNANVREDGNDTQLRAVMDYYGIDIKDFIDLAVPAHEPQSNVQ